MRAAGAGIPAFYTPTAVGTELAEGRETRVINGREYLLEYALPLDYAFIRARRADTFGNLQFHRAQRNFNPVMATAARMHDRRGRRTDRSGRRDRCRRGALLGPVRASPGAGAAAARGTVAHQTAGATPMSGTKGLNRQQMADLIARQFQDGWIVNLGVGIPTMCSNTDIGETDIVYHSENGVIGYGAVAAEGRRT